MKGQISVRIEQYYLDLAYTLCEVHNERITDLLERAIVELTKKELKELRPYVPRFARFVVPYATPEEERRVLRMLGYSRMPKTDSEKLLFEANDEFYALKEKDPEFEEAIKSFGPKPKTGGDTQPPEGGSPDEPAA